MSNNAQQDIALKIKEATRECESAYAEYRRTGSTDRINACNRRLGALHDELWRVDAGIMPDYDR
jgi:hypothetical protein